MTDFTNFPIWANAGTITTPLFINSGWVCGQVNPEHMNWWFNRADKALVDLNTRVVTNTTNIALLSDDVDTLSNSLEASGTLGAYVSDSTNSVSYSYTASNGSPGLSAATTLKTFNHTIQATGDVHLVVGYDATPNLTPAPGSFRHFTAKSLLYVNNKVVMSGSWGRYGANNSNELSIVYGAVSPRRHIHAAHNWALVGHNGFPVYKKGDVVNLNFKAFINTAGRGAIRFGFLKLIILEIRATDV